MEANLDEKTKNCPKTEMRNEDFCGTNGSGTSFTLKQGLFTSHNVQLTETSINNLILRVPLEPITAALPCENEDVCKAKNVNVNRVNGSLEKEFEQSPITGKIRTRSRNARQFKAKNNDKSYYLSIQRLKLPVKGKLNYSFSRLIRDVKTIKLPSPLWKIKIVIRKGKDISSIIFTNKLSPERSIGFSRDSVFYDITIDNKPALLLGSPFTIDHANDLEILLDIVQNIHPQNPMIMYK